MVGSGLECRPEINIAKTFIKKKKVGEGLLPVASKESIAVISQAMSN